MLGQFVPGFVTPDRTNLHAFDPGRRCQPIQKNDQDAAVRLIRPRIGPRGLHPVGPQSLRERLAFRVPVSDQRIAVDSVPLLRGPPSEIHQLADANSHDGDPERGGLRTPPMDDLAPRGGRSLGQIRGGAPRSADAGGVRRPHPAIGTWRSLRRPRVAPVVRAGLRAAFAGNSRRGTADDPAIAERTRDQRRSLAPNPAGYRSGRNTITPPSRSTLTVLVPLD